MANQIIVDAVEIVNALHKQAAALASRRVPKAKGVRISNSVVDLNAKNLEISIDLAGDTLNQSECNKLIQEYLKLMFGEESAQRFKPSDLKKDKDGTIDLKIDDLDDNNRPIEEPNRAGAEEIDQDDGSGEDSEEDSEDNNSKEKMQQHKKKEFNLFDAFMDQVKDGLNVLRSIEITPLYGNEPIKIGKMIFGTTHDINDTKSKIQEVAAKALPGGDLRFDIYDSKSLFNKLFVKKIESSTEDRKHWLDSKTNSAIRSKILNSKYTLAVKVLDSDENADYINKDFIFDIVADAIGFKPDSNGIEEIPAYVDGTYSKSIEKDPIEKFKKKLRQKFNKQRDIINRTKNKSNDNKENDIKDLANDVVDEFIKELKNYKDIDKEELDKERKEFKNSLYAEIENAYGEKARLYVVPLTTDKIFNKLRHTFDDLGGKSTSDKNYGVHFS